MKLNSYEGFLHGHKPACYENTQLIKPDYLSQLLQYPHIFEDEVFALFFQNEQIKLHFLEQTNGLERSSSEYIRILGLTLGYPPKAVDFYVKYFERRKDPRAKKDYYSNKVGFHYVGIMFESHINDLLENTLWLWNTYKQPYEMYLKVVKHPSLELIQFPVGYMNLSQLLEAKNRVEEEIEKVRESLAIAT